MTTATGRAPVRVDIDVLAVQPSARVEPVAARSNAELLADAAAAALLAAVLMPVPWRGAAAMVTAEALGIGSVVTVLLALGLLPAGSPALQRLAALGERLGAGFPIQASGLATPAAGLPESWEAVLADRGRRDGPSAITRVAVALPELDGAHIALTGLESAPDRALLHMLTVGWDPPGFGLRAFTGNGQPSLSWWARDSAGRWHTAFGGGWGRHGNREWSGVLQLRPPLHPAATSLDLTVTGTSERLRIELPLRWHAEGPDSPTVRRSPPAGNSPSRPRRPVPELGLSPARGHQPGRRHSPRRQGGTGERPHAAPQTGLLVHAPAVTAPGTPPPWNGNSG